MKAKKVLLLGIVVPLILPVLYILLKPARIDPVAYQPQEAPAFSGPLQENTLLREAELLANGEIYGPEDSAMDSKGRLYAGTQDGKIVRFFPGEKPEVIAETGGRPLGMEFHPNGNLIVCDAYKGLLSVDPNGKITTLTTSAGGVPFAFTDDVDIASDGMIYFTDASYKYGQKDYLYDLLEGRPNGRFLSYDVKTGETKTLLSDLYFANGVAVSQNEDFVLINETYRYRITRYWLKGPKAGSFDVFIDNLPGFPDGISSNRKGTFWVAMYTVRNSLMDSLHPSAYKKGLLSKLPHFMWPKPAPYGLVLALNEQGEITASYHDPGGEHIKMITSVEERNGYIYLGSLYEKRLGRYRLK